MKKAKHQKKSHKPRTSKINATAKFPEERSGETGRLEELALAPQTPLGAEAQPCCAEAHSH
jgi:hypothetical protein